MKRIIVLAAFFAGALVATGILVNFNRAGAPAGAQPPKQHPATEEGADCPSDPTTLPAGFMCYQPKGGKPVVKFAGAPPTPTPPQPPCTPKCESKVCGDDGCGGSCGTCPSGQACKADGTCEAAPAAPPVQKTCTYTKCSGTTPFCVNGTCSDEPPAAPKPAEATPAPKLADPVPGACQPKCDGKACGDDGCGGTCGECKSGETCDAGKCVLVIEACNNDKDDDNDGKADCLDEDCDGDDACTKVCKSDKECPGKQICVNGKCVEPPPTPPSENPCRKVEFSDDANPDFGCVVAAAHHVGGGWLTDVRAHVARISKGKGAKKAMKAFNSKLVRQVRLIAAKGWEFKPGEAAKMPLSELKAWLERQATGVDIAHLLTRDEDLRAMVLRLQAEVRALRGKVASHPTCPPPPDAPAGD